MNRLIASFEARVQPYWLRHVIIALVIQLALWPLVGLGWSTAIAATTYILHELHDHFVLHKNDGKYDWLGMNSPLAAIFGFHYIVTVVMSIFGRAT